MKKNRRARKGFTLIEIMVVVVIIGLLASLVGPEVWRMLGFGQASIAEDMCKQYYNKAHLWRTVTKKWPESLEDMKAPLHPGAEDFLDSVQKDPWGNDYQLVREGRDIYVLSWGKDGQDGTDDDIRFPEAKE